jgi:peroxiredoxin Q/BCP
MKRFRSWMFLPALFAAGSLHAEQTPQPGMQAPAFTLPDSQGKPRQLADWRGQWLVLYFYPKDDTPGCTREAINFRDRLADLAALKAQVVGVSLDDGASHQAFAEKQRLPFPLLADAGGQVAQRYGALTNLGFMKFAKRYTFLIDPDGVVAKTYLKVDADTHVAEVIADLKALK